MPQTLIHAATAFLLLALAGCGADGLPPTASLSTETSATGSAFPSVGTDARPEALPSPFADPSEKAPGGREVIEKPTHADIFAPSQLPEMAWGNANSPLTVVQYASLTCPHCRNFHTSVFPAFKRDYIDTGKVRYILREFPIGKTSGLATIALRCAPPDKYLTLYGKFMEQQASWVSMDVRPDAVFAVAQQVGMTRPQFDACRENQGMIEALKWVKERGRKLGIIGTPNYFVGDKLIKRELTLADIQAFVDGAPISGTPTASAAKPAQ